MESVSACASPPPLAGTPPLAITFLASIVRPAPLPASAMTPLVSAPPLATAVTLRSVAVYVTMPPANMPTPAWPLAVLQQIESRSTAPPYGPQPSPVVDLETIPSAVPPLTMYRPVPPREQLWLISRWRSRTPALSTSTPKQAGETNGIKGRGWPS